MELSVFSWPVNIEEITVRIYYFGLALINNCLALRQAPQAGENPDAACMVDGMWLEVVCKLFSKNSNIKAFATTLICKILKEQIHVTTSYHQYMRNSLCYTSHLTLFPIFNSHGRYKRKLVELKIIRSKTLVDFKFYLQKAQYLEKHMALFINSIPGGWAWFWSLNTFRGKSRNKPGVPSRPKIGATIWLDNFKINWSYKLTANHWRAHWKPQLPFMRTNNILTSICNCVIWSTVHHFHEYSCRNTWPDYNCFVNNLVASDSRLLHWQLKHPAQRHGARSLGFKRLKTFVKYLYTGWCLDIAYLYWI